MKAVRASQQALLHPTTSRTREDAQPVHLRAGQRPAGFGVVFTHFSIVVIREWVLVAVMVVVAVRGERYEPDRDREFIVFISFFGRVRRSRECFEAQAVRSWRFRDVVVLAVPARCPSSGFHASQRYWTTIVGQIQIVPEHPDVGGSQTPENLRVDGGELLDDGERHRPERVVQGSIPGWIA